MKKVFRAIGGFFAKIGRWIANTAWIQPLLIVGGIFAVIFSIPYIKRGIEGLINANKVDADLEYYKAQKLDLSGAETGESQVDKLLTYLEDKDYESVTKDFAEKFYVTFVSNTCGSCKDAVGAFKYFDGHKSELNIEGDVKFYTIFIDTMGGENDKVNLTKKVFENHEDLFDNIVAQFAENEDYPLLKNVNSSARSTLKSSIEALSKAVTGDTDIQTPTTFMIDLTNTGKAQESFVYGVTALFFSINDLIDQSEDTKYDTNDFTKAKVLANCWNYSDIFDVNYENNK